MDAIKVRYTNWRGETADRIIKPLRLWWGNTEWHPESQWMIEAEDVEKGALRDFALADMVFKPEALAASPEVAKLIAETKTAMAALLGVTATRDTSTGEPLLWGDEDGDCLTPEVALQERVAKLVADAEARADKAHEKEIAVWSENYEALERRLVALVETEWERCIKIVVRHWEGEPEDTIAMAAEMRVGMKPLSDYEKKVAQLKEDFPDGI